MRIHVAVENDFGGREDGLLWELWKQDTRRS